MTSKLEELFNLAKQEPTEQIEHIKKEIIHVQADIDKIDFALPLVDMDSTDAELDELSDLAKEKFEALMDLGFNVEPRFSAAIFQAATALLSTALSAKEANINKKLKMIDLQLKKALLDQRIKKEGTIKADTPIEGVGMILDRNALLNTLKDTGA